MLESELNNILIDTFLLKFRNLPIEKYSSLFSRYYLPANGGNEKYCIHSIIFRSYGWIEQISQIKLNLLLHHFVRADSEIVHCLSNPWRFEIEIHTS